MRTINLWGASETAKTNGPATQSDQKLLEQASHEMHEISPIQISYIDGLDVNDRLKALTNPTRFVITAKLQRDNLQLRLETRSTKIADAATLERCLA